MAVTRNSGLLLYRFAFLAIVWGARSLQALHESRYAAIIDGLYTEKQIDAAYSRSRQPDELIIQVDLGSRIGVAVQLFQYGDADYHDEFGNSPLHYAVANNNFDISKMLLRYGGNSRALNALGNTPLHLAAMNRNVQLTKLLRRWGSSINIQNKKGDTPLHLVFKQHRSSLEEGTLPETVTAMFKRRGFLGRIPLFPRPIVQQLENAKGYTALDLAILSGHSDIVEEILKRGAVTWDPVAKRDPLLNFAIKSMASEGTIRMLLKYGADPNSLSRKKQSSLVLATRRNREYVVRELLFYGADASLVDAHGETALHHAARTSKEIAEILVRQGGADVEVINNKGQTPLLIALENEDEDMVGLLASFAAEPIRSFPELEL